MRKKRKYVRRKITNDLIIDEITRIRTRNNKQWMSLLRLAFKAKPRLAQEIMGQIVRNDRLITTWMAKLGYTEINI